VVVVCLFVVVEVQQCGRVCLLVEVTQCGRSCLYGMEVAHRC